MKQLLLAIAAMVALLSSSAFAQTQPPADVATSAAVRNMLEVMDYRTVLKLSMAQMSKSMPEAMAASFKDNIDNNSRLDSAQRKNAMILFDKKMPAALDRINRIMADPAMIDEMMEAMIPVWTRIYTLDEIEQLTAFYRSPIGRKTLSSMPQMVEGVQASQQIVMPRLNAVISDLFKSREN